MYIPKSELGLVQFRYLLQCQDGGHCSDVSTCQIGIFHCSINKIKMLLSSSLVHLITVLVPWRWDLFT